jgi:hypothetical protein
MSTRTVSWPRTTATDCGATPNASCGLWSTSRFAGLGIIGVNIAVCYLRLFFSRAELIMPARTT